ncbi:hypothetical protein L7F22_008092 [Adiantum nelumboides]|nr:hypothetical protein [Adiantum nelumboides]
MPMDLLVIMRHIIREQTVALDAACNTTTAIGKGFAIGSAALVLLALFGAYVSHASLMIVDVLSARAFVGLIVGAMLPYWFSAMTTKSVGKIAVSMVEEVRRQFNTIPGLMEGVTKPDYATCVKFFYRCIFKRDDFSWCFGDANTSHYEARGSRYPRDLFISG